MQDHHSTSEVRSDDEKPVRRKWRRRFVWVTGIVVIVLAILILLLPSLLSVPPGKNLLVGGINRSIDGRMGVGDLSLSWWKGVRAENIAYADSDGITSVKVDRVTANPGYLKLLMGDVTLRNAVIESPHVVIRVDESTQAGRELAERLRERPEEPKKDSPDGQLPVQRLEMEVRDGLVEIQWLRPDAPEQSLKFSNIASKVSLDSDAEEAAFEATLLVQGDGGAPSKVRAQANLDSSTTESADDRQGWTFAGASGDIEVEVETLELQTLHPLLALLGQEMRPQGQLNANAAVRMEGGRLQDVSAQAQLNNFSNEFEGKRVALAEPVTMNAQIHSRPEGLEVEALSVVSAFLRLNASGQPESINYEFTADLAPTQQFLAQFADLGEIDARGQLQASGVAAVTDKAISATGKGELRDLVVRSGESTMPRTTVQLAWRGGYDRAASLLNVEALDLSGDPGTLQVRAQALPLDMQPTDAFRASAAGQIDLRPLTPFVAAFSEAMKDVQLAGRAKINLQATAEDGVFRITAADNAVRNFLFGTEGEPPMQFDTMTLSATGFVNPQQRVYGYQDLLFDAQGATPDGKPTRITIREGRFLRGVQEDGQAHVEGALKAEYDGEAVMAVAGRALPAELRLAGRRTGSLAFESTWPADQEGGMLTNLDGEAAFGIESAAIHGLNVGSTDIRVKATDGLVTIAPIEAPVNQGIFRFAGTMNLAADPMVLQLAEPMTVVENVQINDAATELLKFVNPIFADAANVRGRVTLACEQLAAPLSDRTAEQMNLAATISIEEMYLTSPMFDQLRTVAARETWAQQMRLVPTPFTVSEGRLAYDDMQINIGDNPLNFGGAIQLTGEQHAVNMQMRLPWRLMGRTARVGQAAQDRVVIPIGGTLEDIKVNFEKILEQNLPGLLEGILRRGIEDLAD